MKSFVLREPRVPSRTIVVKNVPADDKLFAMLIQRYHCKVDYRESAEGTVVSLVAPTERDIRQIVRQVRAAGYEVQYKNYYIYFTSNSHKKYDPESIYAALEEIMAGKRLLDVQFYLNRHGNALLPPIVRCHGTYSLSELCARRTPWKGDGHIVLDKYDDMTDLFHTTHSAGPYTFTFYAYTYLTHGDLAFKSILELAAMDPKQLTGASPKQLTGASPKQLTGAAIAPAGAVVASTSEQQAECDVEYA